jgi:hypothetical protein
MDPSDAKSFVNTHTYSDKEKQSSKIKIQHTTVPINQPSYEEWCRQLNVSRLHGRSDEWLDHLVTEYKPKKL